MKTPMTPNTATTYQGYHLYADGKDYFLVTHYRRCTGRLLDKITEQVFGFAPAGYFRNLFKPFISSRKCTLSFSDTEYGPAYKIKGTKFCAGKFLNCGKLRMYEID